MLGWCGNPGRDIFEFDEDRAMNCDGDYPYFGVETDDKTSFSCCNGYLYNKTAQICLKDEEDQIFKPYFIDCGDTPVPEKDQLECANGEFADIVDGDWNGCLEKNSYIFRCPARLIPCQQMREVDGEETLDFVCDEDCSNYGGKRKTCNGGKMHIYIFVFMPIFIISPISIPIAAATDIFSVICVIRITHFQ